MTPVETILAIQQAGGTIEVRGDRLALRAKVPLPAELVAAAREHRDVLLEMLKDQVGDGRASNACPARPCPNCRLRLWWQRADGGWVCGVCHPDPQVLLAEWRRGCSCL